MRFSYFIALLMVGALAPLRAADVIHTWPDPATLPAGSATTFRAPPFSGLPCYPDKDPLYNILHVPPSYDPTRSYPLCVRFQPQGGKPWTGDMTTWFGKEVFVLAVSWVHAGAADNLLTIDESTVFLASIHWVMNNWNIDRSRILVGGFSMGGWGASSVGMSLGFDRLSTHFVIMGAGIRGEYRLPPHAGQLAIVANGSDDMNVKWGEQAAIALNAAKLVATRFVEPGVGHAVGPAMIKEAQAWYAAFDPSVHAADWLAEGATAFANRATMSDGFLKLQAVATLGSAFPQAAEARTIIDRGTNVSEIREQLTQAHAALGQHDFHATRVLAGNAFKAASKAKAPHLQQQAEQFLRDSWEWQCIAHQVEVKSAWDRGCPQEALMLAQAGNNTYKKALSDWGDRANPFPNLVKTLQTLTPPASDKAALLAQQNLVQIRLKLWGDKLANERVWSKEVEQLRESLAELPDGSTKQRGEELLRLLQHHGEWLDFAAAEAKP